MEHIGHLIHKYGLVTVAGVIGLESVGLPFPGETVLVIAGVYAGSQHDLNIVAVIFAATGGAVIGQMIGYVIGHEYGYWLLLRYGGYIGITESRIKLGQYLFLRHGGKIIIVARFIPLLRSIAGILAGANRMPWRQFLAANIVGALLWSSVFGLGAYYLGRQIEKIAGPMVIVLGVVAVIAIIAAGVFVRGHEAELVEEAERALPGPVRMP